MQTPNEPSTWKRLSENSFFALIISILTVLFGVVLSQVQSEVGWLSLVLGLLFVLGLYLATVWFIQRPIIELLAEGLGRISQQVGHPTTSFLYTSRQLLDYEQSVKCPDIWILTADLLTEVERDIFKSVVLPNIGRGVRYIYFVPNTELIHGRIAQMRALYPRLGTTDDIQFKFLPDTFFFLVANLEIAIYNPLANKNKEFAPRSAYMGLPTATIAEEGHYYASIAGDLVDTLVGHLDRLIASATGTI